MNQDPAADRFACKDGERAAFEAGIKVGAAYHQFTGAPVSSASVGDLERAIRGAVAVQPFVTAVEVEIDRGMLREKTHQYDYSGLTGRMLRMSVTVEYGEARATARVRYHEELDYPLFEVTVTAR